MAISQHVAKQIDDSVKKELQELTSAVTKDQPRREQVAGLREKAASMQGILQSTEASLVEARLECVVLKTREQENFRHIASLESQVSQILSESVTASGTYTRLHELEACNKDLTQRNSDIQTEVAVLSEQLQQKESSVASLNNQLAAVQLQMEEAKAKNNALFEQKSLYQQEIAMQQEQLRKELSDAANAEVANLQSKLANLQNQLSRSQKDVAQLTHTSAVENEKVKSEKIQSEKATAEKMLLLQRVQGELQKEVEHMLPLDRSVLTL